MAPGAKNAPPETAETLGEAPGAAPAGTRRAPGAGRAALGPGGPPGARSPEAGHTPRPPPAPGPGRRARARLPPTPHFPSVRAPGPAGRAGGGRHPTPRCELWVSVAAPHAPCLPPSATARRPRTPSPRDPGREPAAPPPARPPVYLLRERAGGVEAGAASSGAQRGDAGPQPFPAAATALSGAARGWPAAGAEGRRATGARRGDTAARRPAGEEQPRRRAPREGGWAAEWGGVSASREWLPRRPGGSPPSSSLAAARSPPRPLVRPGLRQARGPAPGAGLGDPGPRARPPPPPALGSEPGLAGSAAGDPFLLLPKTSPESLPSFPLSLGAGGGGWGGSHRGASPFQCVGFSGGRLAPMNETIKEPEMRVETSGAVSHRGVQPFAPSRAPKATRGHKVGLAGYTLGGTSGRTARPRRGLSGPWAPGARTRPCACALWPAGFRARGPRPLCALGRRTRRGRLRPGHKGAHGGRGLVRGGRVPAGASRAQSAPAGGSTPTGAAWFTRPPAPDLCPTWSFSESKGVFFPLRSRR